MTRALTLAALLSAACGPADPRDTLPSRNGPCPQELDQAFACMRARRELVQCHGGQWVPTGRLVCGSNPEAKR